MSNVPIPDEEDWPFNIRIPRVIYLRDQDINYCSADELTNLLIDFRWERENDPSRYDCPLVSISLSDKAKYESLVFLVDGLSSVDCPRFIVRKPFPEEIALVNKLHTKDGLSIKNFLKRAHQDNYLRIEGSRKIDRPLYRPLTL